MVGHPIEDCWVFKDWIEKQYKTGAITLSRSVLMDPQVEETNLISTGTEETVGFDNSFPSEFWNTFLTKKTRKMLKKLKETPGITWRGPLNPRVQPTPLEDQPSSSSKLSNPPILSNLIKKKKIKKPVDPEPYESKKTELEEYIDSLEDYIQKERDTVLIKDFVVRAMEGTIVPIRRIDEGVKFRRYVEPPLPPNRKVYINLEDEFEEIEKEIYKEAENFWQEVSTEACRTISAYDVDSEDEFTSALEDNIDDGVEEDDGEEEFRQKLERKNKEEQSSTAYAQRVTNYRLDSINDELFNIRVEQKEIAKMVIGLEARVEQVLRLMAPTPRRARPPRRNNRLQEMMERIEKMMAPDADQEQAIEDVSSQNLKIVEDQDLSIRREKQQSSRKNKNNQILNPNWHQSTDRQEKHSIAEKKEKNFEYRGR